MRAREYHIMYEVELTHWWFISRRAFLAVVFRALGVKTGGSLRIADIGAGTGGMYAFLSQYGRVVGIEPHPLGRMYARKRHMPIFFGKAEATGLKTNSLDMVCSLDVLYHKGIHDDRVFAEAYRVLRHGGLLVITVCAIPWLVGPHDQAVSARKRYILSDLVTEVRESGFDITKQTYTYFFLFPLFVLKIAWGRVFIQGMPERSDVAPLRNSWNAFLSSVCGVEASLLSTISYPWGSSLLLVAKKP